MGYIQKLNRAVIFNFWFYFTIHYW